MEVSRIIVSSSRRRWDQFAAPPGLARSTLDLLPISRQPRRRAQRPPGADDNGNPEDGGIPTRASAPLRATAPPRRRIEELTAIPIARAAHLLLGVEVLRDIGVPVARELARSRLPGWIEAMPDAYVSIPFALDFIARCRDAPAIELGFLAARRASLATFSQRCAPRSWPRRPASHGSRRSPGWPAAKTARSGCMSGARARTCASSPTSSAFGTIPRSASSNG